MEIMAELAAVPETVDQFIRKILGMRGHESYPLYSVDIVDASYEIREVPDPVCPLAFIAVNVLTQEHDFLNTVLSKAGDLP